MGSALKALNVPSSAETFSAALEGLVGVDEVLLRRNPDLPPVYESGVKYKLPPHRVWRYPPEIVRDGWGDCEGLSCWRAAELRVSGADPDARVLAYRSGPRRYHAVVARGDGWIEDPSIVCGMREHDGMPWTVQEVLNHQQQWPRQAQVVVGAIDDAFDTAHLPSFEVVKHADGYTGVFKLPTADGKGALIANTSVSPNAAAAIEKGRNLSRDVSAVINSDPETLAQMNPYSAVAVKTLSDPAVQANLRSNKGILTKAGDVLERPEVTALIEKLGPYGAIAAGIIRNPAAREVRQISHEVLRKVPLLGKLF